MKKLVVLVFSALTLLAPAVAWANGETYYWQSSDHQAIIGQAGSYKNSVTFQKSPDSGDQATFQATGSCSDGSPGGFTVSVPKDQLNGDAAKGSLSTICPNFDSPITIAKDQSSTAQSAATQSSTQASDQTCDQGSLTWLECPLVDRIEKGISGLVTDVMQPILKVNQLSPSNTPTLYKAWQGMRALANALFVVIFLIIIFASTMSMGLDQYTIRKALPRLVLAAILVQMSFVVASLMVDAGNIFGAGIQGLIFGLNSNIGASSGGVGAAAGNTAIVLLGGGTIVALLASSGPMLLPVAGLLLLSLLAFFLTIAARFLLIAVLVVLAPLAFAAWVLPNTAGWFKKWWSLFLRLILMYPIIMAILAFAGRVNELLAFSSQSATNGASGLGVAIVKPLIFIAAFALIPATFRWAGGLMSIAQGRFNQLAGRGHKAIRDSDSYKDRENRRRDLQLRRINALAATKPIYSLTHSKNRAGRATGQFLLGAGGLAMGRAPSTDLARARAYGGNLNTYAKEMEDLPEAQIPTLQALVNSFYGSGNDQAQALKSLQENAPAMLAYRGSSAGRIAALKRLDKPTLITRDIMRSVLATDQRTGSRDYGLAIKAGQESFAKKPTIFARYAEGELDNEGRPHHAGELKTEIVGGLIGGLTGRRLADDFHQENFQVAQEEREVAEIMADKLSAGLIEGAMNPEARQSFVDANKRAEIIKMVKAHHDIFSIGKGVAIKDSVKRNLQGLSDHDPAFLNQFVELAVQDPYLSARYGNIKDPNLFTPDMKAHIVSDWLDRPGPYKKKKD